MHFCLRRYVTERFSEPAAAERRARVRSICAEPIACTYKPRTHGRLVRTCIRRTLEDESELESGVERESEAADAYTRMYTVVRTCMRAYVRVWSRTFLGMRAYM